MCNTFDIEHIIDESKDDVRYHPIIISILVPTYVAIFPLAGIIQLYTHVPVHHGEVNFLLGQTDRQMYC